MANNKAFCRVCEKEFVPCGKSSAQIGAFNYREVACSPECGQEYLKRVLEGRKVKTVEVVTESTVANETIEIFNITNKETSIKQLEATQEEVNKEVDLFVSKKINKKKEVSEDTEE